MLVSGAPASDKTTLARRLGERLRLPVLSRDPITALLADQLRPASLAEVRPLSRASFRLFYGLIDELLSAGVGVVAETNLLRGRSEAEAGALVAGRRAALVHCRVPRDLSVARFEARFAAGERHWYSFDQERIAALRAGQPQESWERAEPLEIGVPVLEVDTTDGYRPGLGAIVRFCRATGRDG